MRVTTGLLVSSLLASSLPGRADAAGFYLYEFGSPSVGLASAGYAARAADAETVFTNPAGMTRLKQPELLAGLQALYGSLTFTPSPATSVQGTNGGNAVGLLPGGSLFFVIAPIPRLALGIGVLQYFGSALEYEPDWVGRYYGQKGVLLAFSLLPSVAYRVTDWLAIGAGLNVMPGFLRSTTAVNNVASARPDGQLVADSDAWGFGANVGFLFEVAPTTRVGVAWLSAVSLGFTPVARFSGLGPGLEAALSAAGLLDAPIGLGVTLPNRITVGVHQDLGTQWSVMADVGWESWSQFGKMEIDLDSIGHGTLTRSVDYRNTWHFAGGAQFRASPSWLISFGLSYDTSMMADEARTVLTPVGAAFRVGVGVEWSISRSLAIGVDDTFVWGGNLPLSQNRGPLSGQVVGEYRGALLNMFAVNLRWRLGAAE